MAKRKVEGLISALPSLAWHAGTLDVHMCVDGLLMTLEAHPLGPSCHSVA